MVKLRARRIRHLLGGTAALLLIGLAGCAYDPYYDGGAYAGGGYGYSPGYAYGSDYGSGYGYGPADYYYPGGGYYAAPGASVYYYGGDRDRGNRYYRRDDHDNRNQNHNRGNWNQNRGGRNQNYNRGPDQRDHRGGGRGARDVSPLPGYQPPVRGH